MLFQIKKIKKNGSIPFNYYIYNNKAKLTIKKTNKMSKQLDSKPLAVS